MLEQFYGYPFWGTNSELSMIVNKKSAAQQENMNLLLNEFNYWSNIAVSRIKWVNLPETVDERLLNIGLYCAGQCAFFEHETLGLIALPCNSGNRFNILYQPIEVTASGYSATFNLSNVSDEERHQFELVRFTPSGIPQALGVMSLVSRMVDILRAIDVITQRLKRPYVVVCEEKERTTIDNAFKKVKDNEELILAVKDYGLSDRSIQLMPTSQATVHDYSYLWESYKRYETKLYTMLGIDNKGYDKKERVLVDEVNANTMIIKMADDVNLKELRLGLDRVNETFHTAIYVEIENKEMYEGGSQGG